MKKFTQLIKLVEEYKKFVESDDFYEDHDYEHYIYEEAVTAILGEDFWKVLKNKLK